MKKILLTTRMLRGRTVGFGHSFGVPKAVRSCLKEGWSVFIKKLFLLIVVLVMALSEFVGHASKWNEAGNYNISWYSSNETLDVSTPAELAGVAYLINNGYTDFSGQTINIKSDINMSGHTWEPIGKQKVFKGSINGLGHKVSGVSLDDTEGVAAFIGNMSGGEISSLVLETSISTNRSKSVAALVFSANSCTFFDLRITSNLEYVNPTFSTSLDAGVKIYQGGVCGEANKCSFKDIVSSFAQKLILGKSGGDNFYGYTKVYAGGIVASGSQNTYLRCETETSFNNTIYGYVTSTSSNAGGASVYCGGIVGYEESSKSTMTACYSKINKCEGYHLTGTYDEVIFNTLCFAYFRGKILNCVSIVDGYSITGHDYSWVAPYYKTNSLFSDSGKFNQDSIMGGCYVNNDVNGYTSKVGNTTFEMIYSNRSFSKAQMNQQTFVDELNLFSSLNMDGVKNWEIRNGQLSLIHEDYDPSNVLVTNIELNQSHVTLHEQETLQLTASIIPSDATNKEVFWSSDANSVATVDNSGMVKALSEGIATITCTAKDGSGVIASCQVIVNPSVKEVETLEVNSLMYRIYPSDNTAVVARQTQDLSGTITIPERISYKDKNYTVTEIGDSAFWQQSNVIGINISPTIKKIGNYAFQEMYALTSIEIPDNVESTGRDMFSFCSALESVYIGGGLKSLDIFPFWCCPKLSSIKVSERNQYFTAAENILYSKDHKTVYKVPETMSQVTLHPSVETIRNGCFGDNDLIETINLPDGLLHIYAQAFGWCDNLVSIDIPDKVTDILNGAFKNCKSLKTIKIGKSVTKIGPSVFATGSNYSEVYIRAAVPPTIEESTFDNYAATLYVPVGSKSAYANASYWKKFHNIVEDDLSVQDGDMVEINSLRYSVYPSDKSAVVAKQLNSLSGNIRIPKRISYKGTEYTIVEICDSAFWQQSEITDIDVDYSSKIKKIGNYAFSGASSLTSFKIANEVEYMGNHPFDNCSSMWGVYIGKGLKSIGTFPFWRCPELLAILVSDDNQYFDSNAERSSSGEILYDGGNLYSKDHTILYKVPETRFEQKLYPVVQIISDGCFENNDLIENFDLPVGLIEIRSQAFMDCDNLKSIDIPDNVTDIYSSAFKDCRSLKNIKIGEKVKHIYSDAFATGSNYSEVYIRATVPPTIEESTFDNYAATLYVPIGCKSAYSNASYWKNFRNIAERDPDGVEEIVLSDESLEMNVGDEHTLTYTITPADAKSKLIWTSSDSEVATVENGVITAVGPGTATITCTADDGNRVSASCQVTVKSSVQDGDAVLGDGIVYIIYPSSHTAAVAAQYEYWDYVDPLDGEISVWSGFSYKDENYVVTALEEAAFAGQEYITGVELPSTIEKIGDYAFDEMNSLKSIEIPDNVKTIGNQVFSFCESLESVHIGSGLSEMGTYTFYSCPKLSDIQVPYNNKDFKTIGGILYSKDSSIVYKVPETMENVVLEPEVEYISNGCFALNTKIKEISLPQHLWVIAAMAFEGCSSLQSIDIPDEVEYVWNGAFMECESLKTIKIGYSVIEIGPKVFATGSNYSEVYISAEVPPMIEESTFDNYAAKLYVPIKRKSVYASADYWKNFRNIVERDFDGVDKIELSDENLEMTVGDEHSLTYTITPADAKSKLIWKSSDSEVATVDNGVITAVGPGTATITCTAEDGNRVSASCQVTVKCPIVLVESIELDYSSVELTEGEGVFITATINPSSATDSTVKWESSDVSVADVWGGYVFAFKPGTATITCTANDGSGVSASCQVTVNKKILLVESIELNYSHVELTEREGIQLSAKINPASATDSSVTWSSSDKTIAVVDDEGYVATLKPGTATITCTANDGSGVSASCQLTVIKKIVLVESIELNHYDVELAAGEGIQLTAMVNPESATDSSVTWSSSDKTIAVVDDEGYVATLKPGTATITCTANDGSGVSASCQLTVIKKIVLVESIELNHYDVELAAGEGIQLTAIVNPESATDSSVTWSSSDKSVAVVDREGYVAAMKEGTATITCTANDGSGVTAYCTITVIDNNAVDSIYGAAGIKVETGNGLLRISTGRKALVNIYTMNGILIRKAILESDETMEISLTPGVYIVNGVKYMVD